MTRHIKKIALFLIIATEFCERFCYYGLRALIFPFMIEILGMSTSIAKGTAHAFFFMSFLFAVIFGFLSDIMIGHYITIITLSFAYLIGTILLIVSTYYENYLLFILSIFIIAMGTGGIKPCISIFGGDQFENQSFFYYFYFSINCGAMISMLTLPIISKTSYLFAFSLPFILVSIGILLFIAGTKLYIIKRPDPKLKYEFFKLFKQKNERNTISAYVSGNYLAGHRSSEQISITNVPDQLPDPFEDLENEDDGFNEVVGTESIDICDLTRSEGRNSCKSGSFTADTAVDVKEMSKNKQIHQKNENFVKNCQIEPLPENESDNELQIDISNEVENEIEENENQNVEEPESGNLNRDLRAILNILKLYAPIIFFWTIYDQQATSWTEQASKLNPNVFGLKIIPSQMLVLNALLTLVFIPLFSRLKLSSRRKMVFGFYLGASSFFFSALIEHFRTEKTSILVQIPQYILLTSGEVLLSVTGLEYSYSMAPYRFRSLCLAIWLFMASIGNVLVAIVSKFELFKAPIGEYIFWGFLAFFGSRILDYQFSRIKNSAKR